MKSPFRSRQKTVVTVTFDGQTTIDGQTMDVIQARIRTRGPIQTNLQFLRSLSSAIHVCQDQMRAMAKEANVPMERMEAFIEGDFAGLEKIG